MPFALLFNLLSPLLVAAIQTLLPWLIDRIKSDLAAGRETSISPQDIRMQMQARRETIRTTYQGRKA